MERSVNRELFFLGKSYVVGLNRQTREKCVQFFCRVIMVFKCEGRHWNYEDISLKISHSSHGYRDISLRDLTSTKKFHIKTILAFLTSNSV